MYHLWAWQKKGLYYAYDSCSSWLSKFQHINMELLPTLREQEHWKRTPPIRSHSILCYITKILQNYFLHQMILHTEGYMHLQATPASSVKTKLYGQHKEFPKGCMKEASAVSPSTSQQCASTHSAIISSHISFWYNLRCVTHAFHTVETL